MLDPEVRASNTDFFAEFYLARILAADRFALTAELEIFYERPAVDDQVIHDLCPDSEEEDHKAVVVVDSDAVVDPRAVMVEPVNTFVANGTVAAARGSDHFTFRAQIRWVDISQ